MTNPDGGGRDMTTRDGGGSNMTKPEVGQAAPDAPVPDSEGNVFSIEAYRGKNVVLYFYPKDATPG